MRSDEASRREDDMSREKESNRTTQQTAGGGETNPGDQAPPGTPGTGENICRDCRGTGRRDGEACPTCGGSGKVIEEPGGA
jgi:DnaJ-class molecular chaperone